MQHTPSGRVEPTGSSVRNPVSGTRDIQTGSQVEPAGSVLKQTHSTGDIFTGSQLESTGSVLEQTHSTKGILTGSQVELTGSELRQSHSGPENVLTGSQAEPTRNNSRPVHRGTGDILTRSQAEATGSKLRPSHSGTEQTKIPICSPETEDMTANSTDCPDHFTENGNQGIHTVTTPLVREAVETAPRTAATDNLSKPYHSNSRENSIQFKPTLRQYQEELAEPGLKGHSYIVCAPTGSGKTVVASCIIANHLKERWKRGRCAKVVFFANLVPLVQQQYRMISECIQGVNICKLFGEMRQDVTDASSKLVVGALLKKHDVVVCTDGILQQDLEHGRVKCGDITLLVVDECHRALPHKLSGVSLYGKIMLHLLRSKQEGGRIPQIVGLTASPGTGSGKPTRESVRLHVERLCAYLNAEEGLKVVVKHKEDLRQHCRPASQHTETTSDLLELDDLAQEIMWVMQLIEANFSWKSEYPYGSTEYSQWASGKKGTLQSFEGSSEDILAAEHLEGYSKALNVFEDLNAKECLAQLESGEMLGCLPSEEQAVGYQSTLHHHLLATIEVTKEYKKMTSENLDKLEFVLLDVHKENHECKAIIFVPTKHYAYFLQKWIEESDCLKVFRPSVCVGTSGPEEYRMTASQQDKAIEKLRTGEANVLIGTSILEEGLDVPDCDCSILYDYVKNDISRTQAQGRARKEGSKCITIVTKGSSKERKEKLNKERVELFEQYIQEEAFLSRYNKSTIEAIQRGIVSNADKQVYNDNQLKSKYRPEDVSLVCKRCETPVCKGNEVYLFGMSMHMVLKEDFKCSIDHNHDPGKAFQCDEIKMFGKVSCPKCNSSWGKVGQLSKFGDVYLPILSAKDMKFKFPQAPLCESFKKWSKVPFRVMSYDMSNPAKDIELFSLKFPNEDQSS